EQSAARVSLKDAADLQIHNERAEGRGRFWRELRDRSVGQCGSYHGRLRGDRIGRLNWASWHDDFRRSGGFSGLYRGRSRGTSIEHLVDALSETALVLGINRVEGLGNHLA